MKWKLSNDFSGSIPFDYTYRYVHPKRYFIVYKRFCKYTNHKDFYVWNKFHFFFFCKMIDTYTKYYTEADMGKTLIVKIAMRLDSFISITINKLFMKSESITIENLYKRYHKQFNEITKHKIFKTIIRKEKIKAINES